MKVTSIFFLVVLGSNVTFALDTDSFGCREAQAERSKEIYSLGLSKVQMMDVYNQCLGTNRWYWFTTQLYISARKSGDTHETALSEYNSYFNINYTIANYEKMRSLIAGKNLSLDDRRTILAGLNAQNHQ
jgi:hypothetical protein